jgi:RNA polymerase sigma-70 factor (ECF subfamily)
VNGLPDHTDAELLELIASSNMGALREFYARHAPWLSLRLQRRCHDPDLVASALQDCFLSVWRHPGSWRGEGEVAAWLWGIAIRRVVSGLRSRPDTRRALLTGDQTRPRAAVGAQRSAEELVLEGVEYGDLGAALDRLSPQLHAVVQATVLDGLTSREAARLLGIPQNTVKTRLHRAKAQLRRELATGGQA